MQDQTKYQDQEIIVNGTPAMIAVMAENWSLRLWRQSGQLVPPDGTGPIFHVFDLPITHGVDPDMPSVTIRVSPPRHKGTLASKDFGWITLTMLPGNRSQMIFAYPETDPSLLTPWTLFLEEMQRLGYLEAQLMALVEPARADGPAIARPKKPRRTNSDTQSDIIKAGKLFYQDGLTHAEIQVRLNKSESTIKRYLRQYRKNTGQK